MNADGTNQVNITNNALADDTQPVMALDLYILPHLSMLKKSYCDNWHNCLRFCKKQEKPYHWAYTRYHLVFSIRCRERENTDSDPTHNPSYVVRLLVAHLIPDTMVDLPQERQIITTDMIC